MREKTKSYEINLTEAEVKSGVEEYLQYSMNQGKLWFCRLNAGDFVDTRVKEGHVESRRRIKGVPKGTADFIVIQGGEVQEYDTAKKIVGKTYPISFVTFIECKSSKGKLRKEQQDFAEQVRKLNCKCFVVRSVEELQEVLDRE